MGLTLQPLRYSRPFQGPERFAEYEPIVYEVMGLPATRMMLTAGVNSTVVADENLTVGSTVRLPAESLAPGR
jgi:hypothetical protein